MHLRTILLTPAIALCVTSAFGVAGAQESVPLGRFAQPYLTGVGTLCNLDHNIVVERAFALNYLAKQRRGERWGAPTFAGFFTVLINGKTPAYTLLNEPQDNTQPLLAAPTLGKYAKHYSGDFGRVILTCEEAIGSPLARFTARFEARAEPLKLEWLITGYHWMGQTTPAHWEWWSPAGRKVLRVAKDGSVPIPRGKGFLLAWSEGRPYTLALLPAARPQQVKVAREGVTLTFASGKAAPGKKGRLPDLYAAALDAHPSDALLAILPELAHLADPLLADVGWQAGKPFVRFGREPASPATIIPVPPPFSAHVRSVAQQDTPLGQVAFAQAREVEVPLSLPPNLELLTADFPTLPPDEKAAVESDVTSLLAHQEDDGQFTFSLGRPFYDGQTAGVLIQLAPLVDEPLRTHIITAVRKTLDYWWARLQSDARTGTVHLPEPSGAPAVVDYPEISSTVLYPTAAYAHLYNREYAKQIWPKVASLAATVGKAYDITGSAWAHAGPEYVHVLTESTVGGYLAYACLYHLAKLAGEENAAQDFRARACWAFAAMDLYRWREEYGRGGILSQYFGDGLFVEPALAWDYTMFTWFSWCPLWSLPPGDPYHVFEVLQQQRWWLYWRDSRQLAYDFSHFMAFIRFGDPAKGLAHWDEILTHQPTFDNFDTIALYRPLARAWKHLHAVRTPVAAGP